MRVPHPLAWAEECVKEAADNTLTPLPSYHLAGKWADLGTVHCARSKANPSLEHQWQRLTDLKMRFEIPRWDLVAA